MFTSYYEVRDWLEGFIPLVYGKEELGLARIEHLLKFLGNPEKKFKSIHIAGTSGKGSTAFYTAQLLRNCKLETNSKKLNSKDDWNLEFGHWNFRPKVGLHVSPHLIDIRERMQINDQLMSMNRFIRLFNEIAPIVEKIKKGRPELTPSYFEILVAASFKYFADEKVDWAVVEVGLGGRLDATNVLQPLITLITNIGLDHTEILGDTVKKIAFEKAGIIKGGVPVITAANGKALKVIEKVAKENGSGLIKIDTQGVRNGPSGRSFSDGVILAISALKALKIPLKKSVIKKVFSETFDGRFEEIEKRVIVDGAHNPDKIRALIRWIKSKLFDYSLQTTAKQNSTIAVDNKQWTVDKIILVLAFKKGKNWKEMVDLLMKNLPIKKVIATQFFSVTDTDKFAAVLAVEIAEYVSSIKCQVSSIKVVNNSQEAVFSAVQNLSENDLVLVTGSLYLVGEVRTMWHLPEF